MFGRKAPRPPEPGAQAATASDQVTITETAPCRKSVRLRVGHEAIAPIRAAVLEGFRRDATLPGFRKGKAPAGLIQRQYAKGIQDETLSRAMKQAFEQIVKDHALKPVGPFEVTRADFSEADGLHLEATVEVEPSFPLGDYKGVPLAREPLETRPEELEQALASLRESMAQMVPSGEGEAKARRLPALDDELAKDLGFETLEKLKEHVEAKLREQKRASQAQRTEAALCEELLRRHPFTVPPRLVGRQTERLTRDFKVRLLLAGTPEAQVEADVAKFTDELRTSAERHVKLAFILDRIAAQETITVTEDELVGRVWQLAQRWKKDPAEVRRLLDAQQLWPSVLSAIRQEKTIAFLIGAAAIENGHARHDDQGTQEQAEGGRQKAEGTEAM